MTAARTIKLVCASACLILSLHTPTTFASQIILFQEREKITIETDSIKTQGYDTSLQLLEKYTGVRLYRLGKKHFLYAINLKEGGDIQFLTGKISDPGRGKGAYGSDNPSFRRQNLQLSWKRFQQKSPHAVGIVNGSFFKDNKESSTQLAWPVRSNFKHVTDGYAGGSEYYNQKQTLTIWPTSADITPFNEQVALKNLHTPHVLVGLSPVANKSKDQKLNRTFIGVKDSNQDSVTETVLILVAIQVTQETAQNYLEYFGAKKILMADGGGSTQMRSRKKTYVSSTRSVPQMIGITYGSKSVWCFSSCQPKK